jgi:2-polyprenyl-3-methyl-5-hydroxy-6-metoxy-1,4-benzoquinol methylase
LTADQNLIMLAAFQMASFFGATYKDLIHRPNGLEWWQSIPLPDGNRIAGAHADHSVQQKLWKNLYLDASELTGKRVLDVGANDGFFTIAALLAGAQRVTAINTADRPSFPENLIFACAQWNVVPEVVIDDFQTHLFDDRYDVIFFLGVLYHLENIFAALRRLHDLLNGGGRLFIETQMSMIESALPIYEAASDIYPTIAKQDKDALRVTGMSNFLFPNVAAMHNLAYSYDFACERLTSAYTRDNPSRGVFRLTKLTK